MIAFNIIPIKTQPSIEPDLIITESLSEKDSGWTAAELKNNNLHFGSYLAFEKEGSTYLYWYDNIKKKAG